MKKCAFCQAQADDMQTTCPGCGMPLPKSSSAPEHTKIPVRESQEYAESPQVSAAKCPFCKTEVSSGQKVCPGCGAMLMTNPDSRRKKSFRIPKGVMIGAGCVCGLGILAAAGITVMQNMNLKLPSRNVAGYQEHSGRQEIPAAETSAPETMTESLYFPEPETVPETEAGPVTEPPTEPPAEPPTEPPTELPVQERFSICSGAYTWQEAQNRCQEQGGHLAYIKNQEEYDEILRQLSGTDLRFLWLGGITSVNEYDVVYSQWLDDTPLAFIDSHQLWYPGEPSGIDWSSDEKNREPYIMLWKIKDQWSFNDNSDLSLNAYKHQYFGYVCQFDN